MAEKKIVADGTFERKDLCPSVYKKGKTDSLSVCWLKHDDFGYLFASKYVNTALDISVTYREALIFNMTEDTRQHVVKLLDEKDVTWYFYTLSGLRILMSVKKVSHLEDRRKFASWFDKNLAVSLSKDTCKSCSLASFVENTRDIYELKDVVTGNEENIVLAKQKKILAEKKAKEANPMKAHAHEQEQGKISEVVSYTKNESVSSNLPASQKEVRKFDGMLGSVRVVMRENKPWFVAKDVAACIEYDPSSMNKMCNLCRDKDKAVVSIADLRVSEDSSETLQMFSKTTPTVTLISESGLYRILAKCSLPKCEPFESWIFDTVLPSIEASNTTIEKSQHETHIIHNQNSYQSPDIGIGSQTFCGVRGYEKEGVAYLHIEDVARGLGFTQSQVKNGKEYTSIRWERIDAFLADFGFPPQVGESGNPHDYYIPENLFYRLCMKAKNEVAEAFQAKVADDIIPSIRKTGSYSVSNKTNAKALPHDYLSALKALVESEEQRLETQKALSAEQDAHNETRLALTAETEKNEALVQQNNYMAKVENSALATASRLSNDNKRLSHDIYLNEMYVTQAMSDGTNYHVERNRMFRSVYEFVTQSTTSARIFKQDVFKNTYIRNSLLTKIDNEMLDVFVKYISRAVANGISESFIKDVFKIVRKSWDKKEIPNMGKRSPDEVRIVLNAIYEYVQEQKDSVVTSNFKDIWAPPKYSLVIWSQWFRSYFKSLSNCRELHDYLNTQTLNALRVKEEGYDMPRFVMDECAKNFGFFVTMQ